MCKSWEGLEAQCLFTEHREYQELEARGEGVQASEMQEKEKQRDWTFCWRGHIEKELCRQPLGAELQP